jgi:hypothetical protein
MKNIKIISILILSFIFNPSLAFSSSTRVVIKEMKEAEKILDEKAKKFGAENVLVVYDIDHTLLTTYGDLGASYWFGWQAGMLKTPEKEPDELFNSFAELVTRTAAIFCATPMRTVERTTTNVYSYVQKNKFPLILLTARSHEMRETTERDLLENHLPLPSPIVGKDIKDGWLVGKGHFTGDLTPQEITDAKLDNPTPVTYKNGVMMVDGQDKGAMLRALLSHFNLANKYKAIVLIDDSETNCKNMERNYANLLPEVTTLFYTNEHPRFEAFKAGATWASVAEWERVKNNKAYQKFKNGHCR